jgi:hypothetical protein
LRKLTSILLIIALFGLGSGAIEYLHNLDHHPHDVAHHHDPADHDHAPADDKSDCEFHYLLRAPILLTLAAPLLSQDATPIDSATFICSDLISQHAPTRIDCRGPPTC